MKRITQRGYENKSFIKECQNIIENAIESMVFDQRNCENMPQMTLGHDLPENKQVISCDFSKGQYVGEKARDRPRPQAWDSGGVSHEAERSL